MAKLVRHLINDKIRTECAHWCMIGKYDTVVTFTEPKRSIEQNKKMWPMLTDVSMQVDWHGQHYSTEDWKILFLTALGHELRLAPSLSGSGLVNLGRSSSNLSKPELSALIEY
ncbi:MAG: NinB family protein, partial [Ketobacter sp.]|nr:NinB family protein [Ketobacter sp.]